MRQLCTDLSSWNNYPRQRCQLLRPERYQQLDELPANLIARGLGRSYGDAALNGGGQVALMTRLNRFLRFDAETGEINAEAGVSLGDILEVCVPAGWFVPVVPGTQWATLGGCIASDVHGKNHPREGSFGAHLKNLQLHLGDGRQETCSPDLNTPLFDATLGGMGLTGVIGNATLQLQPIESAWMDVETQNAANLSEVMALLAEAPPEFPYQVAWIDCLAGGAQLGRSIFMRARHAGRDMLDRQRAGDPLHLARKRRWTVPVNFPSRSLNRFSVRAFNAFYYHWHSRKQGRALMDYQSFFFPLDTIGHWNRIYGRRGFLQYQCVIPDASAETGLTAVLERLSQAQCSSFLAVIKRFGDPGRGLLSFPCNGFTLALDIPNPNPETLALLTEIDALVLNHGGRVYLAKDARLAADNFARMYPQLETWRRIKSQVDPANRFTSSLARRLQLEATP